MPQNTIEIDAARVNDPVVVGEVVYNTKIGALQTVESFDQDLIGCVWFAPDYTLCREMFERKHLWPVLHW